MPPNEVSLPAPAVEEAVARVSFAGGREALTRAVAVETPVNIVVQLGPEMVGISTSISQKKESFRRVAKVGARPESIAR